MREQFKPPAGAHRLPHHLTTFVGRQQELEKIVSLLSDPACRLLTLLGPGGIGKTRLAIQSAAELRGNYSDGVYFVALQPVQSVDFLVPAVIDALGVHLSDRREAEGRLFNYLQDKEILLLLDNFEHLLDGAALLTDLLQFAPAVKLLITSREALNLPEECLFPVEGMSYPAGPQRDEIESFSAVQLFTGCARRLRPDFSPADEQEDIVRICQLVEGTPLALELAASWVKTLRCAEIAAEIQHNLDFLTSRWRGMPEKHRSVRSVFNQSWALLRPSEQAVFKRLSVFCGGFRRQAAEQIAGASLVSLSALVDKSLVHWEPDGRYQIHELLRQYAAEQLEQSAQDVAQVYDLHCKYYTDFLGERAGALIGGRQREALLEIEAELENIRAAWQWAVEQGKVEPIRKSAEVLTLFYDFRGRYLEGIRALEEACRQLRGQESNQEIVLALALLLVNLGGLYIRVGRLEEAETVLNESQALYHQLDTLPPPGFATDPAFMLGIVASIRGNYAEAARLGEQARQTSEAQHHLSNQQAAYYLLGRAAFLQGQVKLSQEYIQQAYALSEKLKDRWFMAYCLNELGSIACALRQYETAREYYAVSYEIRKEFDDPEGMAVALNYLGQIAAWQENYAEAEQLFQRSLTISQEINNRGGVAAALNGLGRAALSQGNYQTGREWFSQALRVAREGQFVSLILSLLVGVSELLIETGRPEQGQELLVLALNHPGSEHETREQARQKLSHYQLDLTPDQTRPGSQPTTWSDLETVVVRLLADLSAWARPGEESRDEMETVKSPLVFSPAGQPALVDPLTEREIEVLHLLAEGLSNVEIAERLVLAVGTVKYYTSEIYGKLGVRNRTQAATRAAELGLL